jgi:hypothetical protein
VITLQSALGTLAQVQALPGATSVTANIAGLSTAIDMSDFNGARFTGFIASHRDCLARSFRDFSEVRQSSAY